MAQLLAMVDIMSGGFYLLSMRSLYLCISSKEEFNTLPYLHIIVDDTSGTGDPHFMVTSHTTGQHMCFDFHGYRNEVWQLIYDESIGMFDSLPII